MKLAYPYNTQFTIEDGTAVARSGVGVDHVVRVFYKGFGLALFRVWFEGEQRIDYPPGEQRYNTPIGYIETYGYLAEWTKLNHERGAIQSWTEDMWVDVKEMI